MLARIPESTPRWLKREIEAARKRDRSIRGVSPGLNSGYSGLTSPALQGSTVSPPNLVSRLVAVPETGPTVLAPNLKRRLSGVTATIARLVPLQALRIAIRATGPGLPLGTPHMPLWRVVLLPGGSRRVWHARRNTEMLLGLVLQRVFRKDLALVFTSASQRTHSAYTRALIARMDVVLATSDRGSRYLEVPSIVIHHGIDTARFTPIESDAARSALRDRLGLPAGRLVGCFGRIRHQKGTDIFVDAMIKTVAQHEDVTGIVLGRATDAHRDFERDLRDRVAAAGLSERIRFCGEVPVDEVADWYRTLDLFVAPQRWEGFGLTPLEAMACGIPVLATRVGAFEDLLLDGQTGQLVDRDDAPAMARALETAMSSPQMLTEWSAAARTHVVERFSLEQEADALIAIYERLLRGERIS